MISPALPLYSQASNPNPDPQRKPYLCPECWKEAVLSEEKRLPDEGGVLMKAVHTDKSIPDHTWKDYDFDATSITIPSRPATQTKPLAFQQKIFPEGKELELCRCGELGYRYGTYFEHYNLAPDPKHPITLKGVPVRDKYKRCYLPEHKAKQKQTQLQIQKRERPKKIIQQLPITMTEHNELLKIRAEIYEIRTKQKKIAAREKRIRTEQKALEADRKDLQRLLESGQ